VQRRALRGAALRGGAAAPARGGAQRLQPRWPRAARRSGGAEEAARAGGYQRRRRRRLRLHAARG
jgi:hypothetical protein